MSVPELMLALAGLVLVAGVVVVVMPHRVRSRERCPRCGGVAGMVTRSASGRVCYHCHLCVYAWMAD